VKLELPYRWAPRAYQQPFWDYLSNGGLRASVCGHRRMGKDEMALHHAACAMHERVINVWHMLPQAAQARKAIWLAVNPHTGIRRIDEAFPIALRKDPGGTHDQEMLLQFKNGSTWQVVGSDNYDSLVGSSPGGVVFSEYALANPASWAYLRPILRENGGWALFISTPRGKNHFYDLHEKTAREAGWFRQTLTNDDTHVFTDEEMASELRELQAEHGDQYGASVWQQEYFCSFDAAVPGSIWGDCVDRAQREDRIVDFPVSESPVYTAWDLGRTDDTAIWFYQHRGQTLDIIDFHSSNGKDIAFYVDLLLDKAQQHHIGYATHWLPHDARPRTLAAGGKSILQQFHDLAKLSPSLGRFAIVSRLDTQEGVQAARRTFPYCRFHATRCAEGINALRHYHREWDTELKKFNDAAVHDWSSHPSDAFRYLSLSWKFIKPKCPESPLIDTLLAQNPGMQTFGMMKKKFLDRRKNEREWAAL
jgi:phage terminase large subunit